MTSFGFLKLWASEGASYHWTPYWSYCRNMCYHNIQTIIHMDHAQEDKEYLFNLVISTLIGRLNVPSSFKTCSELFKNHLPFSRLEQITQLYFTTKTEVEKTILLPMIFQKSKLIFCELVFHVKFTNISSDFKISKRFQF